MGDFILKGKRGGSAGKSLAGAVVALVPSSFTYDGAVKVQAVASVTLNGQTLTAGTDYAVMNNEAVEAGTHTLTVLGVGRYTGAASAPWSIAKAQGSVSASPSALDIQGEGATATAALAVTGDGALSAQSSDPAIVTASVSGSTVTVTVVGAGTATVTVTLAEGANYLGATCQIAVTAALAHVYGVSWDKTSTTLLTRTDDAALFTDPVPAVGTGSGSSPFDNLMPWSGMVRETIDGNELVKIPKFYFKFTNTSGSGNFTLQISNAPADGFHVSPAHADRGDGNGERDYVYVARYHCASDYKSKTNSAPKVGITRATARSGIQALGTGYYMFDFAMWWTINMLYLVEFADWDCQKVIGYGRGNDSSVQNTGNSDGMTYHTGTRQSSRTTYGVGVQYRWIEDLWADVYDWMDGIRFSSRKVYAYINPSEYGNCESSGGTRVFSTSSDLFGCISDYNVPSVSGLEWALFPSKITGSDHTVYVADHCHLYSSYVVAFVGGNYDQNRVGGLFCVYGYGASGSYGNVGARLQYLP